MIQLGYDDPAQFSPLINAVFACQKLKICLDSLVMDLTEEQHKLAPDSELKS